MSLATTQGTVPESTAKKRHPIGAALLSFVTPGLGQLYNAQPKKAVVIYLLSLSLFPILALTSITFTIYGMMLFLLVGMTLLVFVIVDAVKNAKRLGIMTLRKYNRWGIYVCIFFVHAFLIMPLVEHFFPRPFKAYQMPSGGMMPTLQIGDHLIVDLTYYAKHKPQRGDVPVFIFPEDKSKDFIQRIIGLPGETVEIRDKKVLVNGQELSEPWAVQLDENSVGAQDNFGPKVVPQGGYFFLGDNRNRSYDSRFWGFVDRSSIKGKALYLYWAEDKGRIGATIR